MRHHYDIGYTVRWENSSPGSVHFTKSLALDESLQDIVEYEFEKEYRIPYKATSWYLEPGAREFVKGIEGKWLSNNLDTLSYYNGNPRFEEFLLGKHTRELDCAVETLALCTLEGMFPYEGTCYTIEDDNGNTFMEGGCGKDIGIL
jgi:hypothetical protein